ncbi:MAG: prolipoprotein diacylglyceryl transferase [Lachnospiraceae bacterium]|nr:prolipoprotein diacylglyceryl transferase [Ruminococcus sp.]MCM1273807.1 prolipoprotein diacylglyceryl transferase [Lachnospiraceae bacterium]
MTSVLLTAQQALTEMEVEFPNLFGGMAVNYYRGFDLFGLNIYWYGVLIVIGVILAYLYAMRRAVKDFGLVRDRVFDVVFAALIGGFLCARIYFCVFTELKKPGSYTFATVFTGIRDGGLAIYGGVIGAFVTGFVFCKIRKVNFFAMADLASLGFLIGQTIGRWGNFVNQEAYGEVCSPDWIFGMSGSKIMTEVEAGALVHPCFLYESAWCLVGFVLLHFYSKKLRTFDGETALMYVSWYGLGRFFIEGLRTDSLYIGSLRVSQLVAGVSFAAAMILLIVFKIVTAKKGIPLYVNTDASKELIERDRAADEEKKRKKLAKKEMAAPSILGEGVELDDGEDALAADGDEAPVISEENNGDNKEE